MKKLLITLLLFPLFAFSDIPLVPSNSTGIHYYLPDNTAYLQNLINTSGVLPPDTYTCTNLTLPRNFNMTGSTITFTGTGSMFVMNTAGVTLSGGTIKGISDNLSSNQTAVNMQAANTTVNGVAIGTFGQYAITGGFYSNESVTYCTITDIGYIAVSMISNAGVITGINVSHNTIDRSMLDPATVPMDEVIIRDFAPGVQSGSVVAYNILKMPLNPANKDAEIIEFRNVMRASFHDNNCNGGSIGCSSITSCDYFQCYNNIFSNHNQEAMECGNLHFANFHDNTVNGGVIGMLVDGSISCTADTVANTKMTGLTGVAFHFYTNVVHNIMISNVTASTTLNAMLVEAGAYSISAVNCNFTGNNTTSAIWFDNSPAQMNLSGTVFNGFTSLPAGYSAPSPTPAPALALSYSPSTMSYTRYVVILPITPVVTGSPTSYAITPALPSGLSFSASTGQISGAPLVVQGLSQYTVIAHNAQVTGHTTIHITTTTNPISRTAGNTIAP